MARKKKPTGYDVSETYDQLIALARTCKTDQELEKAYRKAERFFTGEDLQEVLEAMTSEYQRHTPD